ncbi:hypothetical protein PTI98_009135 [Pleurotus ostreatus]|nr:hypothetical protein PTI98_009135 [Pleurotus ostreatus]
MSTCVSLFHHVRDKHKRIFLRQHVSLTGHGAPSFTAAVEKLTLLTQDFDRFLEPKAWTGWTPTIEDKCCTLDANNWFYTLARSVPGAVDITFVKTTDPRGYLERAKDNDFIHTADNVVEYYQYDKGKNLYLEVDPRTFVNGDIVEAHLSFLMVKLSTKRQDDATDTSSLGKY